MYIQIKKCVCDLNSKLKIIILIFMVMVHLFLWTCVPEHPCPSLYISELFVIFAKITTGEQNQRTLGKVPEKSKPIPSSLP